MTLDRPTVHHDDSNKGWAMPETGAGRFGPYEVAATASPSGDVVASDVDGRSVWLRPLPDGWVTDTVRRAAFDADQARLAGVDAPGTVRSESIVADGGRAALVTDAPTATLVDLTTGGRRYPSHQAARLGVQLADALAAAHRAGVVHGGLTPDAVVQSADGHLQLRHFGFATDPFAVTDVATWTAYAAPEQLLDGPPDTRSDLYALGGLLFLLLTGGPPFPDFEADALRSRKLEEAAPSPSRDEPMVPAALDGLVQRLLARDPARRPARAEDVSAELRRLTQPVETTTTRRVAVVDEIVTTPPERTNAWPYVAAILGALLVVAVIIALIVANDDDGPARVTVPSVVGQPAAEAAATLTRRHLDVTTVNQANAAVPAGSVSAQDPAAGARVRRNRVVVLTVSTGVPAVTPVPIPVPVSPSTSSSTSTTTSTSTTSTTTTTTAPPP